MITSLDNERVRRVRNLQTRSRARHKEGRLVIEGYRLAHEAVAARVPCEEVFYTPAFASSPEGTALLDALSSLGAALSPVSEPVMQSMSDTASPQGILAVLPALRLNPPDDPDFVLVIDAVSDPGNMGTIMRTAAAAGVPLMAVTAGTVDLTNPKVLRSAMGAHFRLPVRYLSWEGITRLFADHAIFLAEPAGGAPYFHVNWVQPCALIVSDEAQGPSAEAVRTAHVRLTIPMPGGTESLNVAIAASILLFEMVRQRYRPAG